VQSSACRKVPSISDGSYPASSTGSRGSTYNALQPVRATQVFTPKYTAKVLHRLILPMVVPFNQVHTAAVLAMAHSHCCHSMTVPLLTVIGDYIWYHDLQISCCFAALLLQLPARSYFVAVGVSAAGSVVCHKLIHLILLVPAEFDQFQVQCSAMTVLHGLN
jgi:hypothetical protein